MAGHGALGALFMAQKRDIKMGDAGVLYLLHGDPADPEGEHWGGAYPPMPDERPNYWRDNPDPAPNSGQARRGGQPLARTSCRTGAIGWITFDPKA